MAISASLIAKGITGTLALVAPIATGVVYREEIKNLLVSKETITDDDINKTWKVGKTENKVEVTYTDDKKCSVNITGSEAPTKADEVEKELKEKLVNTTPVNENQRRYKKGFFNKCISQISKIITLDTTDFDLSNLFDLSKESLNTTESENLDGKTFTITESVSTTEPFTITVTVNYSDSEDSSVKECKIIGSAKSGETIEKSKLDGYKDEIKKSVEDKINSSGNDKATNRKNFLTKCKRSFDNEIKLSLIAKTGDTDKYELENLSSIFQSTTNTQ